MSNTVYATRSNPDIAADNVLLERDGDLISGKVRANRNVDFELSTVAGNGFDLSPPNPLIQRRQATAGVISITGQVSGQTGIMSVENTTGADIGVTFTGDFVPVDGSDMPISITASKQYIFSYVVDGTVIRVWPGGES